MFREARLRRAVVKTAMARRRQGYGGQGRITMTVREFIQQRIEVLREEYKKSRAFHERARNAYGSELCSGEMMKEEQAVLSEIDRLGNLLNTPEVDKSREELKSLLGQTAQRLAFIGQEKERLSVEEERLQEYKSLIEEFKKIHLKAAA